MQPGATSRSNCTQDPCILGHLTCSANARCEFTITGARCICNAGYQSDSGFCQAICGDGTMVAGETCDDGNRQAFDGCSPDCHVEPHWNCSLGALGRSICSCKSGGSLCCLQQHRICLLQIEVAGSGSLACLHHYASCIWQDRQLAVSSDFGAVEPSSCSTEQAGQCVASHRDCLIGVTSPTSAMEQSCAASFESCFKVCYTPLSPT